MHDGGEVPLAPLRFVVHRQALQGAQHQIQAWRWIAASQCRRVSCLVAVYVAAELEGVLVRLVVV